MPRISRPTGPGSSASTGPAHAPTIRQHRGTGEPGDQAEGAPRRTRTGSRSAGHVSASRRRPTTRVDEHRDRRETAVGSETRQRTWPRSRYQAVNHHQPRRAPAMSTTKTGGPRPDRGARRAPRQDHEASAGHQPDEAAGVGAHLEVPRPAPARVDALQRGGERAGEEEREDSPRIPVARRMSSAETKASFVSDEGSPSHPQPARQRCRRSTPDPVAA